MRNKVGHTGPFFYVFTALLATILQRRDDAFLLDELKLDLFVDWVGNHSLARPGFRFTVTGLFSLNLTIFFVLLFLKGRQPTSGRQNIGVLLGIMRQKGIDSVLQFENTDLQI